MAIYVLPHKNQSRISVSGSSWSRVCGIGKSRPGLWVAFRRLPPNLVAFDMGRLKVRVTPRGSREEIIGWRDDVLAVRLAAPPVEGAANKACIDFLAESLGVKRSQISLVSGEKSREKVFEIEGLDAAEIRRRIRV